MLADFAIIFSTENFVIHKFSDRNGLVWVKRKISQSILLIIILHITPMGTFLSRVLSCIWYNMTRKTCQKMKCF